MRTLFRRVRQYLINTLTHKLIRAITEDDVLQISGKDWVYKKRKLTSEEILMLKEEAQSFKKSLLFELMYNDLRFQAWKQMSDSAQVVEDMNFGKAMLYNMSLEHKFIKNIIKL